MGWKWWNAGDTLTASDVNTYLGRSSIPYFATNAARDAALTGAAAPTTGQFCNVAGTLMSWSGSAWSSYTTGGFSSSQTLSVAAGSVTFSSIPTTLKSLQVRVTARSAVASPSFEALIFQINGDSSASYRYAWNFSQNGGVVGAAAPGINQTTALCGYLAGASTTGIWGTSIIEFNGWDSPHSNYLTYQFYGGYVNLATDSLNTYGHGAYTAAAAGGYTSITLRGLASSNIVAGSEFRLTGTY